MRTAYPREHPLRSSQLKVNRANVHIKALNRSINSSSRYPDTTFERKGVLRIPSNLPNVIVEAPEIHRLTVQADRLESWGQILGDIINNLRQALDHIAWALATEKAKSSGGLTDSQARRIQFPIFDDPTEFNRKGSPADRTRPFIDAAAWGLIEDYQPYPNQRRNRPELWTLGAINELGNRDKHRLVTPTMNTASVSFPFDSEPTILYFDEKTSLDLLITERARPKVGAHLEPTVALDVAITSRFRPPGGAFSTISINDLPEIHRFIRDEVIPSFAGFFP